MVVEKVLIWILHRDQNISVALKPLGLGQIWSETVGFVILIKHSSQLCFEAEQRNALIFQAYLKVVWMHSALVQYSELLKLDIKLLCLSDWIRGMSKCSFLQKKPHSAEAGPPPSAWRASPAEWVLTLLKTSIANRYSSAHFSVVCTVCLFKSCIAAAVLLFAFNAIPELSSTAEHRRCCLYSTTRPHILI